MGCGISNIRECGGKVRGADSEDVSHVVAHKGRGTGSEGEGEAVLVETHIDDLPDECLLEIMHFLGAVEFGREHKYEEAYKAALRYPLQCALVCKRWYTLADLGVNSLHIGKRVDIHHLLKAFDRWRCLSRLDVNTTFYFFNDLKSVLQSASSTLPCLQNLRLEYGSSDVPDMCTVAYSVPHLTSLEIKCPELPPLNTCSSEILHTLQLTGVRGTELHESLGRFTRLKSLSIKAPLLTSLPTSITQLSLLNRLDLQCPSFRDLPASIVHLTGLTFLGVRGVRGTELYESLGCFTRLRSLSIEAPLLTSLPTSITQLSLLNRLDLRCPYLRDLPASILHLTGLTFLRVRDSRNLSPCPQGLWDLQALRALIWTPSPMSSTLPIDLHHLTRLKDLRGAIIQCFEGLPETMGDLQCLETLELSYGGSSISELPSSLINMRRLQNLTIRSCASLVCLLAGTGAMASVSDVYLVDYSRDGIVSPPPKTVIGHPNNLKFFRLCNLLSLVVLPEVLGECSSLETISIENCPSLTRLPSSMGFLPMLQTLRIHNCNSLTTMPETLRGLTTLVCLSIGNCPSLVSLPEGLGALSTLKVLSIKTCTGLLSLAQFSTLGLRRLEISGCSSLRKFPDNSGQQAPNLESIKLCSLTVVSLPSWLGSFRPLKSLTVKQCHSLTRLPESLCKLRALKNLVLIKCSSLASLPESLGELRALENLTLITCSSLGSLPESLGSLGKLTRLHGRLCPLRELPESIGQLSSLKTLELDDCSLVSLPWSLGELTNLRELLVDQRHPIGQVPDNLRSLLGGRRIVLPFN